MSTATQQAPRGRGQGKRSRGQNQRNQTARLGDSDAMSLANRGSDEVVSTTLERVSLADDATVGDKSEEPDVCWICAEEIRFWSIGECNHITCHVCALRLRALYKRTECTFCKNPQPSVIFASTPANQYQSYDVESMDFKDAKLSIYFETGEMMEDSLILLRFNCPDPDCDYIATGGWADLKWHVRDAHKRVMCDLCIRNKKIFTHEHNVYTQKQLVAHLPSLNSNQSGKRKEDPEAHPMCEFCRECFYSDDESYAHFREKHEECFICKKAGILHQYFQNWLKLEAHFAAEHFRCMDPACLEQKFVVFPTQLDLQAHRVDAHGDAMTSKDLKGARRIEVGFSYGAPNSGPGNQPNRPRAGGGGNNPPDPPPPRSGPPPAATAARPTPGGSRRANFGSGLTSDAPGDGRPVRILPSSSDHDAELVAKHEDFLEFVAALVTSQNGLTAIRSAIKSWRGSESTVYDMLDTIYNVLERNMEKTGRVVIRLAELLEGEKKNELLDSFGGMKAERSRQFPTLTPLASGTMDYAGISSGRVLNVKKNSTRARGRGALWDRVEQAASSSGSAPVPFAGPSRAIQPRVVPGSAAAASSTSTSYPALPSKPPNTAGPLAGVWGGSSAKPTPARTQQQPLIRSVNMSHPTKKGKGKSSEPSVISESAFPTLPKVKPEDSDDLVVANDQWRHLAGPKPVAAPTAWGAAAQRGSSQPTRPTPNVPSATSRQSSQTTNSGGGKNKKKGKETLFTLGSVLPS